MKFDTAPEFEKGLVFRRFHDLVLLHEDMRGQPVHEEYRLFCLHGKVLAFTPFADQTEFVRQRLHWENLASHFTNRFILIDVARQVDGSWIVVEVGDAGVAGLPLSPEPALFYQLLWQALAN